MCIKLHFWHSAAVEELQQEPPPLFVPAATSVEEVLSAYTAKSGFRELSVAELAVALQSGDMVDLLLDVRTAEEFEAGKGMSDCLISEYCGNLGRVT